MASKKPRKCKWEYDEYHGCWCTDCGNAFCLTEGNPAENKMKYCSYCGKEIKCPTTK